MNEKSRKIFKLIKIILILIIIFLLIKIVFLDKKFLVDNTVQPKNFKECLAGNNIIREIYPRQCVDKSGQIFTEDIGNELEKSDLIQIASPRPNAEVSSPLNISGQARGNWFFEASFPVSLVDENNNILASGLATAEGDWMTEDFVPFQAELNFSLKTASTTGYLLLKKDNPSGLKQNDDFLKLPVILIK
ncbi:MAG TPA: Gmad2 immunoglobulin-like domain-containing protein [bacterium]|nr:Gmad2 immunoglobulin-like domain-containing protein [bacterium]